MKELPIIMTADQLIEFLGKDHVEVYRALRAGKIPGAYKAGTRWYISRDQFMKAVTGQGNQPKTDLPWR